MIPRRPLPSITEIQRYLYYNPKTGQLIWKKRSVDLFKSEGLADLWNRKHAGNIAGTICHGSLKIRIDDKPYYVHRLIFKLHTGLEPLVLDHIDQNPLNNRIENLRAADDSKNACNTGLRSDNTSGFKGVSFYQEKQKYYAKINWMGKSYGTGYFQTKEAAHEAVSNLRRKLHGEFACDGV